jgi:light-regulated signal transduction histidine kinase (bacteriophytochrome)
MDVKEEIALSYFKMLLKNATRMDSLLHRLLKVNHVKHAELHNVPIQPQELITEVMDALATTEGYQDMQFYLDIKPKLCIYSDADLIKTVLENLLQNSVHYRLSSSEVTPTVWLKADSYGDALRVTVKDNGIGIEKEYASKIFTLFSKGNLRSQGSGLELYIARAAVSKIKGSIRYCSEITDVTVFEVIIPNLENTPVVHQLQVMQQSL